MSDLPRRIVRDSMIDSQVEDVAAWSGRVVVVLGQNPGPFTGPGTNTYVVGTGGRRLLLDTGQGLPEYLPLLERGVRDIAGAEGLEQIVLTHAHPDHIGGVEHVQEQWGPLSVLKKPWPELDRDVEVTAIDDGAVVATEGATLTAVWTPGHSRDHLCFYLAEEKAVFTGDVVLGAGTTVIPDDGDLGAYMASLRRLLNLELDVIYPAHGPAIRNPRAKIRDYIAHRELRDRQILEGLTDGEVTVSGLVRRIYTDVPEYLHPAAAMSVRAHLRKLEGDGLVEHDGEGWSIR